VLDHIAKPLIKDKEISTWNEHIRELAQFSNLNCKVSGMITEANWTAWKTSDFTPYLDVVFEAFGEDRLMYGSDWPVCKLAGSYRQVYDLTDNYFSQFSPLAKEKFFGGVASEFYRLKG
jgi:L-fuconolactonase